MDYIRALLLWGQTLGNSEQTLRHELLHAAKLDNKHRGELAELAFMRKAATRGFAVAKPWGDCDHYDVVVRAGKVLWRVQVKSAWSKDESRSHYRIQPVNWLKIPYTVEEIDFLVAYIFAEDAWYIFPAAFLGNRKVLCLRPGSKRSRFEQYREAWSLMQPASLEPTTAEAASTKTAAEKIAPLASNASEPSGSASSRG